MLDNQVLQFGVFSWEIRKTENSKHSFIISPNGKEKLLQLSEAIMGEAPPLIDWEFYPAKPAIDWNFVIEVYDNFFVKQTVNTSNWKYQLTSQNEDQIRFITPCS